ncbi:MAG: hypothetical protein ACOC31_00340 [Bacteroidota bacterium]
MDVNSEDNILSSINALAANRNKIWYPKLTGSRRADLREIGKILAKRTTASEADVHLVIMGLVELIPELLKEEKQ